MKKFLLATAAVLASTSAYAADYAVVHPFYTPAQGKFLSTTALNYEHASMKAKDFDAKRRASDIAVSEELKFGVTDDIQVGVFVARDWEKMKEKDALDPFPREANREFTNTLGFGVGYNIINDGKAFLNAALEYRREFTRDGNEFVDDDEHDRYVKLGVTGGYDLGEVTVFGSVAYDRQIDSEKELNVPGFFVEHEYKEKLYTLEAGVFKAFNDQISARTSLEINIDKTKQDKERTYTWKVGTDYSISKTMAVGLTAAYMLDNDVNNHPEGDVDVHRQYNLGIDFKIAF
ncbi:MAG: porin [Alphaproteobacteria bacterium]|nr:porin [Alphaproteobacteria bacterium]